ncbi:macrophage mannose receptor 1-like isoform X1 [Labeo rohita]|uniref:Macrophage mannose receptor 1-like isoform X1 n=1 Tax=Labeo rohita TaxID=84645 RepID=A0A498MTE2_LABRO|nr:macrophage mannose receptor 1-like isoform X1 [Labeo rohita]
MEAFAYQSEILKSYQEQLSKLQSVNEHLTQYIRALPPPTPKTVSFALPDKFDGRVDATQNYIRIIDGKNWTEAHRYCRQHYTDLVNVRNQTENHIIFGRTGGQVWIGLYRTELGLTIGLPVMKTGDYKFRILGCNQIMVKTIFILRLWQKLGFSIVLLYHSVIQANGQMRSLYPACLSSATTVS